MKEPSSGAFSVMVFSTIDDIDRTQWNHLSDDVYMSHGWLKTLEDTLTSPVEYRYFAVLADETLMGAAPCHISYPVRDAFTLDDAMFGRFKRIAARFGLTFLPSLICGSPRGYGQHFLLRQDLTSAQRHGVALTLFDAIEQHASSRKLSISFDNVMAAERELVVLLKTKGFCRTINFPLNYIDIRWKTFEEYIKFLKRRSSSGKCKHTQEINKNRKEGVIISKLATVEPCAARLFQLLNGNYQKYNGAALPLQSNYIKLCKRNLGENATIYIAKKRGQIIGTTILFQQKGTGYITDVGIDHEKAGNDFTYFNLTYYHPIADAIRGRLKRIYYGTLMYRMKSRRGCITIEMYLYYKPRSRLMRFAMVPLFACHTQIKNWFIRRFHM